jgi:hypothetical protein
MLVNTVKHDQNLSKFRFRQQTLELLAEIQHFQKDPIYYSSERESVSQSLKLKLKTLLTDMKKYMDANGLRDASLNEESAFMNKLCDDVFIAYKTMGTSRGYQYVSSRQRSQGENSTFSQVPADFDMLSDLPSAPPILSRHVTHAINQMEDDLQLPVMGRQCTAAINQMEDELQIPIMGRQCSIAISAMNRDLKRHKPVFSLSHLNEDDDDDENEKEEGNPHDDDVMCTTQLNAEDEDAKLKQQQQLLLGISCTNEDEDEDEENDFIFNYKITNVNPHTNDRTSTLVREMTISDPGEDNHRGTVPRCGTNVRFC